jgi:phosphoribosylformimino-5-aminoimidazole carboxamide ribotide isomerase
VFDADPVAVAQRWVEAGATRLHVVDLDGARDGMRANAGAVEAIVKSAGLPVQLGGGIRTVRDARYLLGLGVDRVIFGTAAIEAPDEVAAATAELPAERVMVSVDARDGFVQTRGWTKTTGRRAADLMLEMAELGVRRFMYTDTGRDGTLSHPNFAAIEKLISDVRYPIVMAGGIAAIEDLRRLAGLGVEAVVTGLAIYTGALDLGAAIREMDVAGSK